MGKKKCNARSLCVFEMKMQRMHHLVNANGKNVDFTQNNDKMYDQIRCKF